MCRRRCMPCHRSVPEPLSCLAFAFLRSTCSFGPGREWLWLQLRCRALRHQEENFSGEASARVCAEGDFTEWVSCWQVRLGGLPSQWCCPNQPSRVVVDGARGREVFLFLAWVADFVLSRRSGSPRADRRRTSRSRRRTISVCKQVGVSVCGLFRQARKVAQQYRGEQADRLLSLPIVLLGFFSALGLFGLVAALGLDCTTLKP